MEKLKPCPFCGGKAKVSFRQYKFYGQNYYGDKKISYKVQVICNKCRSRGKPITTQPVINPAPQISRWGCYYDPVKRACEEQTAKFDIYVKQAIEAWNRRVERE